MDFDWDKADSHFDGIGRMTKEGEERVYVDWSCGSTYCPPKHLKDESSTPLTIDTDLADPQFMGLVNLFNDGNEERVRKFIASHGNEGTPYKVQDNSSQSGS